MRERVAANPQDAVAQRDLGLALIQRVRETADPSLYASAEDALQTALELEPDDPLVLVGIGALQLGRHEFGAALETGRRVLQMAPELAPGRSIVVDALVELGRYDEADQAMNELLALRADLSTLARYSYLRELHGDLDGALAAMRLAARSPATAPENTAFVLAIVANLLVYTGDPEAARDAYQEALRLVPGHAPSIAGLGRLAVGRGDLDEAVGHFQRATDILPLPEYVIALGETREAAGDAADARASYELARAQITLFEASGVGIDLELALFEADHGDAGRAVELARAAYAATPTTRAADALAWALYRAGRLDEARKRSAEALRLGSRDPLLRYHAGKIAAAAGDVASARRDLDLALRTDAGFSALGAADARQLLEELGP